MLTDPRPRARRTLLDTPWLGQADRAAAAQRPLESGERIWPKVLLLLLLALVFYLPNHAQLRIETGIRGLNTANILCLLALFALWMRPAAPSEPPPLKVPVMLFVAALSWGLALALVRDRTAWVEDVTVFKNAVFYILLYFLYFYAARDVQTVRRVLAVLLFVVFTSSYLGLRQAMDYGMGSYNETRRVAAPFGWSYFDANRSAVFFCIYLQLVVAILFFRKSRPWLRVACAGILILGVISVFHTYSRQAYFIMALLLMLLALRRNLLVALVAVIAFYNYDVWVPESVVERVVMTQRDPFDSGPQRPAPPAFDPFAGLNAPIGKAIGSSSTGAAAAAAPQTDRQFDESTESRMIIWEGAGRLIASQPWGIGFNRFKQRIGEHVPPSMAGKDAHNYYVLLTTEAGVLAPVCLLVLLGALLRLGLQLASFRDDEECRTLGIGFAAATLAAMLGNIYGSRFVDGDVMGLYWILAAMVARMLLLKRAEQRRLTEPQAAPAAVPPVPPSPQRPSSRPATSPPSRFF